MKNLSEKEKLEILCMMVGNIRTAMREEDYGHAEEIAGRLFCGLYMLLSEEPFDWNFENAWASFYQDETSE